MAHIRNKHPQEDSLSLCPQARKHKQLVVHTGPLRKGLVWDSTREVRGTFLLSCCKGLPLPMSCPWSDHTGEQSERLNPKKLLTASVGLDF